MKKTALITSILLSLTVVVLIGYFLVGCSTIQERMAQQSKDLSNEEIVSSKEESHPSPSKVQVATQPSPERPNTTSEVQHKKIIPGIQEDGRKRLSLQKRDESGIPLG